MPKMQRVSDIVINFLENLGIDTLFTLTGGGAMFLNDATALSKKIKPICNHHEQACAMGAVGYSKIKNDFGAVILTTGCGSTNALTGLLDAWQDNNPIIFISGNVKSKETGFKAQTPLRQFGVQEANIIEIVKSITKYSAVVDEAKDILFHLEKAKYYAKHRRPGPVWIDIPMDIQGALVDCKELKSFKPPNLKFLKPNYLNELNTELRKSKRPILIAGNGIRLGNSIDELKNFVEKYKIPFVVSYLSTDILPSNHPQYIGKIGIKGERAANFSLQNADFILSVGCRLSVALTGFEYNKFGRDAKLFVVDIDKNEHQKNTVKIDYLINTYAKTFFNSVQPIDINFSNWNKKCNSWKNKWPTCDPNYLNSKGLINKYAFVKKMQAFLKSNSIVVADAGSSYYVTSQSFNPIKKQRYITSGAQADMGFTLPAAIGASLANKKSMVVAITGDGSFQMNIQELQTIVYYQLPIKLVVLNNNGYLSIRTTQNKFFSGRNIGTDEKTGVSFPDVKKIAKAYGLPYFSAKKIQLLNRSIEKTFTKNGPVILEIFCPPMQEIIPTVSSLKLSNGMMVSKPLEDMYPFLSREEFFNEMIIKPLKE